MILYLPTSVKISNNYFQWWSKTIFSSINFRNHPYQAWSACLNLDFGLTSTQTCLHWTWHLHQRAHWGGLGVVHYDQEGKSGHPEHRNLGCRHRLLRPHRHGWAGCSQPDSHPDSVFNWYSGINLIYYTRAFPKFFSNEARRSSDPFIIERKQTWQI